MRPYKSEDYHMIYNWCMVRDMSVPPKWMLPETGIIVDYVAVGFLILTNNRCGILDYFIGNPLSDKQERHKALDGITANLIELSIDMDIKMLVCNSQHPAIKDLAIRHGFNFIGNYACFEKGL